MYNGLLHYKYETLIFLNLYHNEDEKPLKEATREQNSSKDPVKKLINKANGGLNEALEWEGSWGRADMGLYSWRKA